MEPQTVVVRERYLTVMQADELKLNASRFWLRILCFTVLVQWFAVPVKPAEKEPLVIAKEGWMYVGGQLTTPKNVPPNVSVHGNGGYMTGQMYVEYQIPAKKKHPFPIVMIGSDHGGVTWTATPDGREGWAQFFLRRGYSVYVVDHPGQGRSHFLSDSPMSQSQIDYLVNHVIASSPSDLYPQAGLHTQWPGTVSANDPAVLQFASSDLPALSNFQEKEELNRDALLALVDKIGPSILMAHSQAGAFVWPVADAKPDLIKALLEIEPNGPPAYNVEEIGPPNYFKYGGLVRPYGLASVPLTYSPALKSPADLKFVQQDQADGPGLARCYAQQEPARQMPNLQKMPIMIMTSEASYHAPYDHCTAKYLTQAGAHATYIRLPEIGIRGNGHLMMYEKNNQEVATVIAQWLDKALGRANQVARKEHSK